jgi:hypothetical protein
MVEVLFLVIVARTSPSQLASQALPYIVGAGLAPALDPWVERGEAGRVTMHLYLVSYATAQSNLAHPSRPPSEAVPKQNYPHLPYF